MKARNTPLLLSVLILILFVDLVAQERTVVGSGTRVRVSASKFFQKVKDVGISTQQKRFVGTLVMLQADTLVMEAEDLPATLIVPLVYLQKLEVSCGQKKSRVSAGAGLGFLGGAVVGGVIGYISLHEEPPYNDGDYGSLGAVAGGIVGGIGGGLIGAAIGASMGGDCWREVRLEQLSH